ncbi:MAG: hypothetical protein CFE24_06775 [Flavobacterium sp. BFFFF2]|nr:MAG: hypothetical protein CFE24_06775 [Flavobacterium sp. BFFFF2]
MEIDYSKIKQELQGGKGLITIVRKRHLPQTVEMARLAQLEFELTMNDFSNIDFALDKLLMLEYEIFLKKQKEITEKFIEYADNDASEDLFPNVRKIIDEYKNSPLLNSEPTKILNGIVNIIVSLADSNRQSRVSRSGSSLMNHISYLLIKREFIFQKDYQREFILKTGCKLDFFFPNIDTYKEEPKNCCAVACQTTSNDRFRLTFAQMPHDTRNRACTAIGNSNFGEKLGPSSLTDNKLEEAKANGVKFVIFSNAIDTRLRNSRAVMSYQEWFEELEMLRKFW